MVVVVFTTVLSVVGCGDREGICSQLLPPRGSWANVVLLFQVFQAGCCSAVGVSFQVGVEWVGLLQLSLGLCQFA